VKRVVFLINSLAGGGAERVMTTLLGHSGHKSDLYDLHLVLLDREPDAYPTPDFVTVHRLDARFSLARSVFQVFKLLRALKPAVVVSFLTRSNFANVAAAILLRHRAVISERAYTSGHHRANASGRLSKTLIRALYPRADKVIAVSQGIAEDLAENFGVSRANLVAIPNPIDAATLEAKAARPEARVPDQPFIFAMGRLIKSKNFSLLVEAFARSRYPGLLVIAGAGAEQQAIEERIGALGLTERTRMVGFLDNPFPFMRAAQAYVLPSNAEGFPNGLAEAMTLGAPVISTNCATGPSELLEDVASIDIDGLLDAKFGLLTPTNAVEPLSEAISMIADPARRESLAERARAGAQRYSLDASIGSYWRVIDAEAAHAR